MTIAIAWVRTIKGAEELVFVSDSRLSGDGSTFDGCTKIITLARSDCAISYAGYTGHAFPLMFQLSLAIDSYPQARRRSLDLVALKSHALKVSDGMAEQLKPSVHVNNSDEVAPDATFLFGGYSWRRKRFELWSISYSAGEGRFVANPPSALKHSKEADAVVYCGGKKTQDASQFGRIAFAGDQAPLARQKLLAMMNEKHHLDGIDALDMEPFEVVRDMLRDPNHAETIGGSPQLVKVYQYMRTTALGVYWPKKQGGRVYLHGRACLGYERIDKRIVDPDDVPPHLSSSMV